MDTEIGKKRDRFVMVKLSNQSPKGVIRKVMVIAKNKEAAPTLYVIGSVFHA
jgi:hypothetical protein